MSPLFRITVLALVALQTAAPPAGSPPSAIAAEGQDELGTIVDAIAEAVPLGKEAIRAITKPIIDTVVITPDEEQAIGNQFYGEVAKRLGDKLDANKTEVRYVAEVGATLTENVRRKTVEYHFHVVDDDVLNAFAIPGGHVFIYRGLLDKVIQNEAQLAAVLGHEISHIDAEHTIDYLKPVKAASQFPLADVSVMVAALASKLLATAYSEVQESEADQLGTRLAFLADYEPLEGATVHRRLAETTKTGAKDPVTGLADAIFRTHPPSLQRAAAIQALAEKLHASDPSRKTFVGLENFRDRRPLDVRTPPAPPKGR